MKGKFNAGIMGTGNIAAVMARTINRKEWGIVYPFEREVNEGSRRRRRIERFISG